MQQDSDESWLEEQFVRDVLTHSNKTENEYIQKRDDSLSAVFDTFRDSATAVAHLYKEQKKVLLRIMEEVQGLKKEVAELKKNFKGELKKNVKVENDCGRILPQSQFTNQEDFMAFEIKMQKNPSDIQQLKKDLTRMTSLNGRKFVNKAWRSLMADNVAEGFSWQGTKTKKCARTLTTAVVIRNVLLNNKNGSNEDFVKGSKNFFQFATKRLVAKNPLSTR